MSKEQGRQTVKRFFVQGTVDLHRQLQHLAIDLDTSAEKLAGQLLQEAVDRKRAEITPKKTGK